MGGRASLIMVIGFAVIFGMINLNITRLMNRSIGGMVGYNESSKSRVIASSGAHAGLAIFTSRSFLRGTLIDKDFTTGSFTGCGYTVTLTNVAGYVRLRSVGRCTTFVKTLSGDPYILSDTVEIRLDTTTTRSFSSLGWMTIFENGVWFVGGDVIWGQVHSNGNINIYSSRSSHPVFHGRVTTSGRIQLYPGQRRDYSEYLVGGHAEEHMPTREFPDEITDAINNATNKTLGLDGVTDTKETEIWVELKQGTSSDNDGYATIRTGSFTGTVVDSMSLSDVTDKVIYSSQKVHVKGTLDGKLSVASGKDVRIEDNIVYERPPDPDLSLGESVNQTKDMLGLIAHDNVWISDDFDGGTHGIDIHAAIFALEGSYGAENVTASWPNTRNYGPEGTIRLLGSVAQKNRGAVGLFDSRTGQISQGFLKNYRYDNRMFPEGDTRFPQDAGIAAQYPPAFPGWTTPGPLAIKSWWESSRVPFNADEFAW